MIHDLKDYIKKYPSDEKYADVSSIIESGVYDLTFRINSYENLFELGKILEALNFNGISPTITIPCLLDAQADKRFGQYQSSDLKLTVNFLNSFHARYKIFHPHNQLVTEALFGNSAEYISNTEFISEVLLDIYGDMNTAQKSCILMSSDAGGFKPLVDLAKSLKWNSGETISAAKNRSWDEKDGTRFTQEISRNDFNGKDILIVDDISIYGGTFKGLAKLLKDRNIGNLYLAVSHITVQDLGSDPVTNYFETVYCTNSKYDEYFLGPFSQPINLKIINIF